MSAAGQWLLILMLGFGLLGPSIAPAGFMPPALLKPPAAPVNVPVQQSSTLSLISPSACPAAGCAPGQRLNLRFDFELANYDPTPTDPPQPNVKACFYAPAGWVDAASLNAGEQPGGVTGQAYSQAADCAEDPAPPSGYALIGAWQSAINLNAFSDSLNLNFRIASSATTAGKVLARLFERNASSTWGRSQQVFTANLPVSPASPLSFVAANAALCDADGYQPCYINSGDDLPGGIGTGLKDAVDALQDGAMIFVVGNYPIKSNSVVIDKAITLTGVNKATLTGSGTACGNSMLLLQDGVTLRELSITDGPGCTANNRTLLEINSNMNVLIEYNLLSGGDRGILVRDNQAAVTVRFNQIEKNAAQAIYWDTGAIGAPLSVIANNIVGNGSASSGEQIQCAAGQSGVSINRRANHNYWGATTGPAQDSTHCSIINGKQLGAAIRPRSSGYGLDAERVLVTTTKTYAFNNEIAYKRSGDGSDFELYLVNHGFGLVEYTPFKLAGGPNPCSNFFDVFLPDGIIPNGTLELSFKYNKSQACVAAINSTQYCDQTSDITKYPLWWYDPGANVTNLWDTTGQNPAGSGAGGGSGQATSCRIPDNEIMVQIDSSGRPNLADDLRHLPFFTGIQVLKTYQLLSSNNIITVDWSTNTEPDVTGFYIERGTDGVNFSPITDLIARKGSALSGSAYQFVDSGRVTGTTYYYRLQIVRPDGNVIYSAVLSSIGTAATATATPTPTRTNIGGATNTRTFTPGPSPTRTPLPPSRTPTPTLVPQQNPTRVPSTTITPRPATPTRQALTLATSAGTNESGTAYPQPGESTPSPLTTFTAGAPVDITVTITGEGTAVAALGSPTATPDSSEPEPATPANNRNLAALAAGASLSVAILSLLALWFFVIRKRIL